MLPVQVAPVPPAPHVPATVQFPDEHSVLAPQTSPKAFGGGATQTPPAQLFDAHSVGSEQASPITFVPGVVPPEPPLPPAVEPPVVSPVEPPVVPPVEPLAVQIPETQLLEAHSAAAVQVSPSIFGPGVTVPPVFPPVLPPGVPPVV